MDTNSKWSESDIRAVKGYVPHWLRRWGYKVEYQIIKASDWNSHVTALWVSGAMAFIALLIAVLK